MLKHVIKIFLVTLLAAFSVHSQQATTPQNTQPTQAESQQPGTTQTTQPPTTQTQKTTTTQTTTTTSTPVQTYVFPDKRERFKRYVKSTVGPFRLARTVFSAGINQWRDNPEEWEQGASGYGKRFASSFGRNAIRQTVEYGLDEALHLDTSFEKSTRKGFFPRLKDALIQNVTSRTRRGNRVISVPRLAGAYAGGIIPAETWYPERYSYKDGIRSGTRSLLTGFGINVFREFVYNF